MQVFTFIRFIMVVSTLLLLPLGQISASAASVDLRISVGGSFQSKNDVQVPNSDAGTRFSLFEAAGDGPATATRVELNWNFKTRHNLRVMLAPLSYTESVTFDDLVQFAGESFDANQPLDATYKFNSWRIGYHYTVMQSAKANFQVGATLKIRDAEIRLEQGGTTGLDDDLGFVPLLYVAGKYRLNEKWTIGGDLDGLAGGPGRAIDLGFTVDYAITKRFRVGADLRVLEGGADVEQVFNFAQFNSAAISVSTRF